MQFCCQYLFDFLLPISFFHFFGVLLRIFHLASSIYISAMDLSAYTNSINSRRYKFRSFADGFLVENSSKYRLTLTSIEYSSELQLFKNVSTLDSSDFIAVHGQPRLRNPATYSEWLQKQSTGLSILRVYRARQSDVWWIDPKWQVILKWQSFLNIRETWNNWKKKIFSWVVTAAHCLNRTAKAFFGLNKDGSFTDMRVIPTGNQFVHPGFGERNEMGVNDIGESFKN